MLARKPVALELLSRHQRAATPVEFAHWLINRVTARFETDHISVLWVCRGSVYYRIPGCDCWGTDRDANLYTGPGPVICHPPCGPWGKHRAVCRQSARDGVNAMRMVHAFGGVVEQPVGSQLFKEYGHVGRIQRLNQFDHGHRSLKPTLLYWVDTPISADLAGWPDVESLRP